VHFKDKILTPSPLPTPSITPGSPWHWQRHAYCILSLNKKFTLFIFCDNFTNCKPIQMIFDRNIADKIRNKPTHGSSDTYSICFISLCRKMTPIFLSIPRRKIIIPLFRQFLPRCMECDTTVRPSVERVNYDKIEERSTIPYKRSFSLVLWEEEWLVGATPSTWNFGSTGPG